MSIGNPVTLTSNVASKVISVTATSGQTVFTVQGGYRINQISVYRNGTRLADSLDYTARDGASVTLLSPATLADVLEFQVFDDFRVADAIVSAASNQTIFGNLTVTGTFNGTISTATNAQGLIGTPNITVGVVTATGGFNLGIQSTGTNVTTGVITALNFIGTGNTFTYNAGTKTVDISIAGGSGSSQVSVGTESPAAPSSGNLWYNTNLGRTFIYYNDGDSSQWVDAAPFNIVSDSGGGASVSIGTEAPVGPSSGDLWYNADYARIFIYYDNGINSQWVDAAPFNFGIITSLEGLTVTGILTATSGFSGNLTGNATGLSGTPNLTVGIVTATSFVGDGTNITGVSGFATALSSTQGSLLNTIFKTPNSFTVGAGTSVNIESDVGSGNIAFTRLNSIIVSTGATIRVATGTTFIMNVLNIF